MKRAFCTCAPLWAVAALVPAAVWAAELSEIRVDLKLSAGDYVVGERIRGVVDIANSSPGRIAVGSSVGGKDRFFVELFRAGDMHEVPRKPGSVFVADFDADASTGVKLETFLADHFAPLEPRRYLARPVLVHGGMRYEGQLRAFDVVEGMKVGGALQTFTRQPGLRREFEAVYWSRGRSEHLFLKARDGGSSSRRWETRDLGPYLRLDMPTVSVLVSGEVVILHRLNQDQFIRSEFWSLPKTLEFRLRETVSDPETAGTARVRELYKEGGVKPKENPWWKFW